MGINNHERRKNGDFTYDLGQEVSIRDWSISTKIKGEIYLVEDYLHGQYILLVEGIEVAKILIYVGDSIKINTIAGYAVQLIHNKKYISIIKSQSNNSHINRMKKKVTRPTKD